MTSVLGHLMGVEYPAYCKDWHQTPIEQLFDIPLISETIDASKPVVQNLKLYSKHANDLIIWTDCDREGEAIGFDIIDLCMQVEPRLDVFRARFSALTMQDLEHAALNLERPNRNLSDAVKVRQEIDLRIGASFTRW